MSVTINVAHGGTDIVHAQTAVHITCTELPKNTATGYDPDNYPASPEVTYYYQAELAGQDNLRSQVFAPDGGSGEWQGLVFPVAGTWALKIRKVADDSQVATTNVTVI